MGFACDVDTTYRSRPFPCSLARAWFRAERSRRDARAEQAFSRPRLGTRLAAVTAVSREDFVNARAIAKTFLSVPPATLATGQVTTALGVSPRKESVLGRPVNTSRSITQPPATAVNRVVIARKTPPSVVPFASREPNTTKIGTSSRVTQTTTAKPTLVKVVSRGNARSAAPTDPRSKSGTDSSSSQRMKASSAPGTGTKDGGSVKSSGAEPAVKKSVVIHEPTKKTIGTSGPNKSATKSSQSTDSSLTKSDSKSVAKDKAKKKPEKKETKPLTAP